MLEERGVSTENMDKKNSSRATSGADSKKLDNNCNKNGKHGRRREPTTAARPRNEQGCARRPFTQKTGGFDKRPRSRGHGNGRKAEEVICEYGAEIGSALRSGAKKTNLNHLLNFTYEPRGQQAGSRGRSLGSWTGRNNWGSHGKSVKYNKEQFLQANCQFVVKDGRDYQTYVADPDTLVDWDLIEQVRIMSHEVPSCPICLYPPTAAKITRCGHIYCWPCMLHYLSLGEKSWRKCPICYEAVHDTDLKSVVGLATPAYTVGDVITMKLLRRERGSTYAMPIKQWRPREGKPHNVADPVDLCYAKLLVANTSQVQRIIDMERSDLEMKKIEDGDTLDGSYVDSAFEKLNAREEVLHSVLALTQRLDDLNVTRAELEEEKVAPSMSSLKRLPNTKVVTYVSAFSDEEADEEADKESKEASEADCAGAAAESEHASLPTDVSASDTVAEPEPMSYLPPLTECVDVGASGDSLNVSTAEVSLEGLPHLDGVPDEMACDGGHKAAGGQQPTTEYYFYQSADGQHIYNHSINARCMLHEYGSWDNCPETITASIVELHSISMNQECRKRLRYLSHLPLTCEFQLAELNLTPPLVSKETLTVFKDEIEKRKKQRRAKSREEKRVARKSQAEERRQMGLGPGLRVSLESPAHFPQYSEDAAYIPASLDPTHDTESMASSNPSTPRSTPILTPYGSPGGLNPYAAEFVPSGLASKQMNVASDGQATGSLSFAQMLQAGGNKPVEAWPKAGPTHRPQGCAPTDPASRRRGISESEDSEPEDLVPVPVFRASFGNAIQEALDRHAMNKEPPSYSAGVMAETTEPERKGKKKKKVKMLLFTTSMARTK